MENATDIMQIIFAVFVFAVAVALLFGQASLAQSTAEYLITESDPTTYYEYYESDMNTVDQNGNRIVTLEQMIPTMYRYFTESMAVTLIDRNGEIITRFDRQTETLCTSWNDRSVSQKELVLKEINYVLEPVGARKLNNVDELYTLFKRIYKQKPNNYHPKECDCPWNGLEALTAQRIDSDVSRNHSIF